MGNRGGQGWGPIREGRKNLEGRITRNCAEGGKSFPQSWLVVPGDGDSGRGSISWECSGGTRKDMGSGPTLPPTGRVTLGWLPLGHPLQENKMLDE